MHSPQSHQMISLKCTDQITQLFNSFQRLSMFSQDKVQILSMTCRVLCDLAQAYILGFLIKSRYLSMPGYLDSLIRSLAHFSFCLGDPLPTLHLRNSLSFSWSSASIIASINLPEIYKWNYTQPTLCHKYNKH